MKTKIEISMDQLDHHTRELEIERKKMEDAKYAMQYHRLQIKQIRAAAKRIAKDPVIQKFVDLMPADYTNVTAAQGYASVGITLNAMQASLYRDVPDQCGLELVSEEELEKNMLMGPIVRRYRSPDRFSTFFVVSHIR